MLVRISRDLAQRQRPIRYLARRHHRWSMTMHYHPEMVHMLARERVDEMHEFAKSSRIAKSRKRRRRLH